MVFKANRKKKNGTVKVDGIYNDIENYTGYSTYWDDWIDSRDGMRGFKTKRKTSKKLSVRKAKKLGRVSTVIY